MENFRKETMWKVLTILTIVLSGPWYVVDCEEAICEQDPVEVDEDFIACCKGKPVFTSEPCVDALFENGTFTQECLIECLYKDFHIYDGYSINLTAVDHFFEENVRDLDMRQMFLNAFKRCSEFDREALLQTLSFTDIEVGNEYGCDIYSAYMDRCVWYHTISHCPERSKSADEQCNKKQLWVRECLLK